MTGVPTQVQVQFDYEDGSSVVVPVGPPTYTPGGGTPPEPPSGQYKPTLPALIATQLDPVPIFDMVFASMPQWGEEWAPTWFGGNDFNGMALDPGNIVLGGGGLELNVSNGGRTGCFMVTNPQNGDCQGFEFDYGYDETDAIVVSPAAWPSIWNNGQNWPTDGENDIMELLGGSSFTSNYHGGSASDPGNDHPQHSGDIAGNWAGKRVKYGSLRTPDGGGMVQSYWDGALVAQFQTYDQGAPHYLILSIGDKNEGGNGPLTVFRRTVWALA
jgi:hypothetical protein